MTRAFVFLLGTPTPHNSVCLLNVVLQEWQLPYYCDAGSTPEAQQFGESRQQTMQLVKKRFSMKRLRVSSACARTVPACTVVAIYAVVVGW